jgi:hypothetical protein
MRAAIIEKACRIEWLLTRIGERTTRQYHPNRRAAEILFLMSAQP